MGTQAINPQIDPNTGERVQIDPATGERVARPQQPIDYDKLGRSMTYSNMTGIPPAMAYDNHDQIQDELNQQGVDMPKSMPTIANDIKVGAESSIFGLAFRNKMPEELQDPGMLDKFVSGISQMVADLPVYLAGMAIGGAGGSAIPGIGNVIGGAVGTFAVPATLREALIQGIQKHDVKGFGDLMERATSVAAAGVKGGVTGLAVEAAGGATLATKALGPTLDPLAQIALKKLQQTAVLTLLPNLMEGQIPTAEEFGTNAALIGALSLAAHGLPIAGGRAKQALMDVYAKDGTTPKQSVTKLNAQPTVKPDAPDGLQPAIRLTATDGSKQLITGDDETHSDLALRATGNKPVDIEQLNANPELADKVLERPETHVQQVIDRAYELKAESGEATTELPPKSQLRSGRGFVTPNGDYLSRTKAKAWMKTNEPDVYDMWSLVTGDPKAEFHSADYQEARERVAAMNTVSGDPALKDMPQQIYETLFRNRRALNEVKAGLKGDTYGKEVIRTSFVGVRNALRAQASQLSGRLAKLVPDEVDQQAISFMRDYRGNEAELQQEIEAIRNGDNEKLQAAIPAMERALAPTSQMIEADKQLTEYFTQANMYRERFVKAGSSIDPANYSPRLFAIVSDEAEKSGGIGRSKFAKRSPHDIKREYLHILDPLQSGDVSARTFNAIDELGVYGDRLAVSVARSTLEMELRNTGLGKITSESKAPADWTELPGTHRVAIGTDTETGKPVPFQQGLFVPKVVSDAMRPILENDVLSGAKYWKIAKLAQGYIKAMELGLSPFHMRAMGISFINNAGLDAYREAIVSDNNSPEFEARERNAASFGVTTTKTGIQYEVYRGLSASEVPERNALLEAVRKGYEPVDKLFKGMTKATFEVVQRKLKVVDFSTKEANWLAKHPDASYTEYSSAMRSIAKEVNAVYGGLNWEVMGVSPNYLAVARMFILAPDWTFSNIVNLKYAGEGGPGGNTARLFWLKSFATGYALTQGMSLMFTGQQSKQVDSVYLGKDDKGKEMYSNVFFAGAPKDAITLWNKTAKEGFPKGMVQFAINKSAPLVGTLGHMAFNVDWRGKPIIKRQDTFAEKTGKETAFAAEQLLPAPFIVKDITERIMNPTEDVTYKDFLAMMIGAQVYHEGQKQKESRLQGGSSNRFRKRKLQ